MKSLMIILSILMSSLAHADYRSSGGRQAPLAVKTHFLSRSTGFDSVLYSRIRMIVQDQKEMGQVHSIKVKMLRGYQGERELCVQYKNPTAAFMADQKFTAMAQDRAGLTVVERLLKCED